MFFYLILLFFLSGFTSLIYQILWLKKLQLVFGVTTPSVVAILVAFMSGLSFGSWFFGRYSLKIKKPLFLYGILEGIIGIYAFIIGILFLFLDKIFILIYPPLMDLPFILNSIRFILSFIILFFPTFLMGGTLPLLVYGTENLKESFGKKTGFLYGFNTIGAFLGTLFSTFYSMATSASSWSKNKKRGT